MRLNRKTIRDVSLGLTLMMPLSAAVQAESATLGRNLAATCANCHGTNGRAVGDGATIAGMPADEMIRKMTQFREGKKIATVMHQIAKGFSPDQVKAIAEYLSKQK